MQQATTAVGRLVFGSVHTKQDRDMDGKPIPVDDQYFQFGVAFPKNGTTHWAQLEYLAAIWNEAHAAFRNNEPSSPHFSWKVQDGDSDTPNKKGTKPNSKEGFAGHWVVTFRTALSMGLFNLLTGADMAPNERIKTGDYVQVFYGVQGNNVNGKSQTDGMYVNPIHVALAGYGKAISSAPPISAAGFGGAPLPPGASTTPTEGMTPTGAPPAAPAAPAQAASAPTTYVNPNTAALNPPPPPNASAGAPVTAATPAQAAPAPTSPSNLAPPPPPQTTGVVMLPAANGVTYEAFIAQGWNDDQLRQAGYIQ